MDRLGRVSSVTEIQKATVRLCTLRNFENEQSCIRTTSVQPLESHTHVGVLHAMPFWRYVTFVHKKVMVSHHKEYHLLSGFEKQLSLPQDRYFFQYKFIF